MNVQTSVDIEFDVDIDDLFHELDVDAKVITVLEEQLDGYISGIKDNDLCSLGEQLQRVIHLTIRKMLAGE